MKLKTSLIAAATLAVAVISSQAQVYSQNIVGYVNTHLPTGFVNFANPLDAGNNSITNVINVFSGNYDGDAVYVWTGSTYAQYTIDSGWTTGIGNAADTAQANGPVLTPGASIFLANNSGAAATNTFTGSVYRDGAGASTNLVGLTTNTIPVGLSFISSKMALGGGVSSVLQLPADGSLDGCAIYVPNIYGGQVHGFNQLTIDSGWSTGFGNAADTAQVAEPVIAVGTGFFFGNTTGAIQYWIQSL